VQRSEAEEDTGAFGDFMSCAIEKDFLGFVGCSFWEALKGKA
jgi:hypothetical protein